MAVAVDFDERVLVLDNDCRAQVFDNQHKLKFTIGKEQGKEDGQLRKPYGICSDFNLNVIIADSENCRIQVFSPEGAWIRTFSSPLNFGEPISIAVNLEGNYVVVDRVEHLVQVLDPYGELLFKFGQSGENEGEFQYPWQVVICQNEDLLIADAANNRIQVFTKDGVFLREIQGDFVEPYGVTVDWDGDIIIPCVGHGKIEIYG